MDVTIPIFQKTTRWGSLTLTTIGLGRHTVQQSGRNALKVEQQLVAMLKNKLRNIDPAELPAFQMSRGLRLQRLRLELTLRRPGEKRRIAGVFPVLLEPRWISRTDQAVLVSHPDRQDEWFPLLDGLPIEEQAVAYFQKSWSRLDDWELARLEAGKRTRLKSVSFRATLPNLLDRLPERKKGIWDDLDVSPFRKKRKKGAPQYRVLNKLGTNKTLHAVEQALSLGMPRSPYREHLQLLLGARRKTSVLLVGPSGAGKTTLLHRWIQDRLIADDYESHRNLDQIHHVWQISGQRIIAGMSYVGDWEARCLDVLEDARHPMRVLLVEDLHAFGKIGRSRESDRNLALFFQGPLARGEITLIGECTPEQLQRLEDEAPAFAALFLVIRVLPTDEGETLRMLLHESRRLELRHGVRWDPAVFRSILQLGGALFPGAAFPGKALDLLQELARNAGDASAGESGVAFDLFGTLGLEAGSSPIGLSEFFALLSQKTGLEEHLLQVSDGFRREDLEAEFSRRILGQEDAVQAAGALLLRLRAGLTDPARPYGVYLFTGPTGTGKTELARTLAQVVYGDETRLLRLDMGEYGTPDAAARLIGDRFRPEGRLTALVRQQPFCVVLFDEIEKAHPSVLHLLLQLFDDGRLTDAAGVTADFTQAVIVMTSNLGSRRSAPASFVTAPESLTRDVARAVREFFPPELFNRIDRIVSFQPLSDEAAEGIVDAALARFAARPGLVERNIFLSASRAAVRTIAREGFDARYGARPLQRYLEQNLGQLMAEHITTHRAAWMLFFWLGCVDGRLRLSVQRLSEREPIAGEPALSPLLSRPLPELREKLRGALGVLDELESGRQLEELVEQIRYHLAQHNLGRAGHADSVYNLDSMRNQLQHFRQHVEENLLPGTEDEEYVLLEIEKFGTTTMRVWGGENRLKLFDPRWALPPVPNPSRWELLEALAELHFLRRAMVKVHDERQHAVFLELRRVSGPPVPGRVKAARHLLDDLADALKQGRGRLEAVAARTAGDRLHLRDGARASEPWQEGRHVVMKMVGVCVLDFYEGEAGCHVFRTLAGGPEVVEVRVVPARPEQSAAELLERRERTVAAAEVEAPEPLLPIVREVRFEPASGSGPVRAEVEDFLLAYSETQRIRNLRELLTPIWLLRQSLRED